MTSPWSFFEFASEDGPTNLCEIIVIQRGGVGGSPHYFSANTWRKSPKVANIYQAPEPLVSSFPSDLGSATGDVTMNLVFASEDGRLIFE